MVVSASFSVERPLSISLRIPRNHRENGILPTRGEILTEILEVVPKEAIYCFQKLSESSFDVTFKTGYEAQRDALLMGGASYKGIHLEFVESAPRFTKVFVKNLPAEVPDFVLMECLSVYGNVKDISRPSEEGVWTGDRCVQMKISSDIPSLLKIGKYPAFIRYRGQRMCCRHCNQFDHLVADCRYKKDNLCIRCGEPGHIARNCRIAWVVAAPRVATAATVSEEDFPALPNGPAPVQRVITDIRGPGPSSGPQQEPGPRNESIGPLERNETSQEMEVQDLTKRPASPTVNSRAKLTKTNRNPFEGAIPCSIIDTPQETEALTPMVEAIPETPNRFGSLLETDQPEEDPVEGTPCLFPEHECQMDDQVPPVEMANPSAEIDKAPNPPTPKPDYQRATKSSLSKKEMKKQQQKDHIAPSRKATVPSKPYNRKKK